MNVLFKTSTLVAIGCKITTEPFSHEVSQYAMDKRWARHVLEGLVVVFHEAVFTTE